MAYSLRESILEQEQKSRLRRRKSQGCQQEEAAAPKKAKAAAKTATAKAARAAQRRLRTRLGTGLPLLQGARSLPRSGLASPLAHRPPMVLLPQKLGRKSPKSPPSHTKNRWVPQRRSPCPRFPTTTRWDPTTQCSQHLGWGSTHAPLCSASAPPSWLLPHHHMKLSTKTTMRIQTTPPQTPMPDDRRLLLPPMGYRESQMTKN
mmetsp:Transcript_57316/g.125518  ORF Transcript_57316/g.125518 Transcript_57316/m.125518 type:complete len:204 (-) Transcript_57316:578-1189(-)